MLVLFDGKPLGSSEGGGGGSSWSPAWTPIYSENFTSLTPANLAGADGERVINGVTWRAVNTAQMTSLAIGSGGFLMGLGSTALEYIEGTRNAAALTLDLPQFFEGTPFEHRNDVELRVTVKKKYTGTLTGTPSFEHLGIHLQAFTADTSKRASILIGSESGNAARRRCWFYGVMGNLAVGKQDYSHTDLAYFPNVVRLSLLENFFVGEFSSSASSEIGDLMVHGITCTLNQTTNLLVKQTNSTARAQLAIARRSSASAQTTGYGVEAILVEARFSPRGIGSFAPTVGM
jgi:hypothetical protein